MPLYPSIFASGQAPAPDPAFNSSATDNDNASETNHDFSLTLASGTDRLLLVAGVLQNNTITFSGATFDQGGANQAAMNLVRQVVRTSGTIMRVALFQYFIPDGVSTGAKTIRLTNSSAIAIVGCAVCYNNVDSPRSDDDELETTGVQPNPLNLSANSGDLVVSVFGADVSDSNFDPANADLSERVYIATANANGVTLGFAEDLSAAPSGGVVDCGWTRTTGVPGGTLDMCIAAAVYPQL